MITLQVILTFILFAVACRLLYLSNKVNNIRILVENELIAARDRVKDVSLREEKIRIASDELSRTQSEFIAAVGEVRIQAYRHGIGSAVGAIEYVMQARPELTVAQILILEQVADELRDAMDPNEMKRRLNS